MIIIQFLVTYFKDSWRFLELLDYYSVSGII